MVPEGAHMSYYRPPRRRRLGILGITKIPLNLRLMLCTRLHYDLVEAQVSAQAGRLKLRPDFVTEAEVREARSALTEELVRLHGKEALLPPKDGVKIDGVTVWHGVMDPCLMREHQEKMSRQANEGIHGTGI
jgi:hypothetical protein